MNPVGQGSLFRPALSEIAPVSSLSTTHRLTQGASAQTVMGGVRLPHTIAGKYPHVPRQTTPTLNLYLCETGKGTNVKKEHEDNQDKTSVDILNQAYQVLANKNIKDSLASFIATVPGDFDSQDTHESMLRTLIDRPPIGGREFLPISEQSLLGFRLHPGSLPEQYQLDPPTSEPMKPQKKKKKHKHKHSDKMDDISIDNYSPVISREHTPPNDPYDFIKPEHTNTFFPPQQSQPVTQQPSLSFQSSPHLVAPSQHHMPAVIPTVPVMMATATGSGLINFSQQPSVIMGAGPKFSTGHGHTSLLGGESVLGYQMTSSASQVLLGSAAANPLRMAPPKPKKKKHDNGDGSGIPKKKKKKEKEKRKKSKHHGLDQPLMAPILPSSVPSSHTGPPPPLLHSNYQPRPQ